MQYQLRGCSLDRGNVEVVSPLVQQMANSEVQHSPNLRSQPTVQELFRRVRTINDQHGRRRSLVSVSPSEGFLTPQSKFGSEISFGELDEQLRWSPSVLSLCSSSVEPGLSPYLINEDLHHSSPPSVLVCACFLLSFCDG